MREAWLDAYGQDADDWAVLRLRGEVLVAWAALADELGFQLRGCPGGWVFVPASVSAMQDPGSGVRRG